MPRFTLWLLLLLISIVIHGWVSSRVGSEIKEQQDATAALAAVAARDKRQVVIEIAKTAQAKAELEEPPTDEPLDFEEDFELEPPEILVAPQGVTPPPPNVPLSLTAQAGGAGEDTAPVEIAVAQEQAIGAG